MKKKYLAITISIALFATGITAAAWQKTYPGEEAAGKMGTTLKSAVQDFNSAISPEKSQYTSNGNIVATVMGENISREYFILKVKLFEVCESDNATSDAWNSIKKEVYERKFAEEHNLLPTEDEIMKFTQEMRTTAESTEESYAIAKAIITAAGFTEDEYWQEYKPKYETPLQLIKSNVYKYRIENNLPEPDVAKIEYEILNQSFFDSL